MRNLAASVVLGSVLALAACSSGGGSSGPGPFEGNSPTGLASLSGIIFQSTGNPLPGATVVLDDDSRTAITNDNGQFILPEVPVGAHTIKIFGMAALGDANTRYGTLVVTATVAYSSSFDAGTSALVRLTLNGNPPETSPFFLGGFEERHEEELQHITVTSGIISVDGGTDYFEIETRETSSGTETLYGDRRNHVMLERVN